MDTYKNKYNKYKNKYLTLKYGTGVSEQILVLKYGGARVSDQIPDEKAKSIKRRKKTNKCLNLIKNFKNSYETNKEIIPTKTNKSWKTHQLSIDKDSAIYNLKQRSVWSNYILCKIKNELHKEKPSFISTIEFADIGSRNITSDIDVNTIFVMIFDNKIFNQKNKKNEEIYLEFLYKYLNIVKDVIFKAGLLWLNKTKNLDKSISDILVKDLDYNIYTPGLIFKIKKVIDLPTQKIIYLKKSKFCIFTPIFSNEKDKKIFIENEISNILDKDFNILKPYETNLIKYYDSFTSNNNEDKYFQNCSKVLKINIFKCLTKLMFNIYTTKYDNDWNSLICCLIRSNKIGSELYFTYSSIFFVVFYSQIAKKNEQKYIQSTYKKLLEIIAIPCFLEQLAFYSLHNKNKKYMKRAKKAWRFIPVDLKTNIIKKYKKMNYNGHKPIEEFFINKDYQQ